MSRIIASTRTRPSTSTADAEISAGILSHNLVVHVSSSVQPDDANRIPRAKVPVMCR
ncbi:MAG TPA: hypothetical protein VMM17_01190 [Gemmatimonadaceae bacterium]|nr:hypothetical protein [Gemmatimonadaceae bacterium]